MFLAGKYSEIHSSWMSRTLIPSIYTVEPGHYKVWSEGGWCLVPAGPPGRYLYNTMLSRLIISEGKLKPVGHRLMSAPKLLAIFAHTTPRRVAPRYTRWRVKSFRNKTLFSDLMCDVWTRENMLLFGLSTAECRGSVSPPRAAACQGNRCWKVVLKFYTFRR